MTVKQEFRRALRRQADNSLYSSIQQSCNRIIGFDGRSEIMERIRELREGAVRLVGSDLDLPQGSWGREADVLEMELEQFESNVHALITILRMA